MFRNKSIVVYIVFVALIELSSCGIGRMPSPIHPDFPHKCYWEASGVVLSIGSRYRIPNQCAQAVCEPDRSFKTTSCGVYGVSDPSCRIVKPDNSLPFPQCCMIYECSDGQGGRKRV